MKKRFTCLIVVSAVVVLPVIGRAAVEAHAPKSEKCNADEIHWTITEPNSVTFDWRGAADNLRYGSTLNHGFTVTGKAPSPMPYSSPGPFRQAVLTDLRLNTLYHYSIGTCPAHTFRTPPPPGRANFTADAEGDIGASTDFKDVVPNQRLIAAQKPRFVLVLGDLTYGAPDQHFNDVMVWSRDAAYMPAWGNNEWDHPPNDLRNFKGRFGLPHPQTSPGAPASGCCGQDWSWFDYGNTRFIAYPEPYTPATWAEWYTKANRLMDQAQRDPKITFIVTFGHRPPYTSGYHHSNLKLRTYMDRLSKTHNKYVLNLNGHSHNYERTYRENGIVAITAGIGGSELEERHTACLFRVCPKPAWSAFRAMHFGVVQLHFTPTEIQGEFLCGPAGGGKNDIHCALGEVVDRFTIHARK